MSVRADRRRQQEADAREDARVMNLRPNEPPTADGCTWSKFNTHRYVAHEGTVRCEFCHQPPPLARKART